MTDSRIQARSRGEFGHAYGDDASAMNGVVEIGEIMSQAAKGRTAENQITVSAFSGLAVQDIAMATAVLKGT